MPPALSKGILEEVVENARSPDPIQEYTHEGYFDTDPEDSNDVDDQMNSAIEETIESPQNKRVSGASTATICNSTDTSEVVDEQTSDEEDIQAPSPPSTKTKSNKKKTPQKPRARLASETFDDDVAEEPTPERKMRKRTVKQEHPYQADKAHYALSKKNGGQKIGSSDVDEVVISTQRTKAKQAKAKQTTKTKTATKAKATTKTKSTEARDSESSRSSSVISNAAASLSSTLDEHQVLENTIFSTYLVDDPETVIDIAFAECQTVTSLHEQLEMTWGQLKASRVSQVKYMLPWKSKTTKHVLAANWDGAFELMVKAIHRAPAWGKKGAGDLEVKLEVTLKE